jgi:hypothetical protein
VGGGRACRGGLPPRQKGWGWRVLVEHGVRSCCGPYKQSERPRAAVKLTFVDVPEEFAGSYEVCGGGRACRGLPPRQKGWGWRVLVEHGVRL